MRVYFFLLSYLLPLFAVAGQPDRLKYLDYQVTRAQATEAGAKLAIAGRELDAYLASDAAKLFDSDTSDSSDELPPEVNAILAHAGIDVENVGELTESTDSTSLAALGYAVFKVCDGENAAVLQLRKAWAVRAFDISFLSLSREEKTEFSPAVVRQVRTELLPVAQAYLDSWLTIAAVKFGCTQPAMRYADFVLADSTNEFADGILGMTRSGLLLNAAENSEAQIEIALAARAKAMAQLRRGVDKLAIMAVKTGLVATKEDFSAEYLGGVEEYDAEFKRTLSRQQTPVWRVNADALAKVNNTRRNICGTGAWMNVIARVLAPEWPTALAVLRAKHQDEAVAAYELADWFDTKNQLSAVNNYLSKLESEELIWQAYGKAETKAEFELAANAITLSAPENGLAIVKLFGHEFLLASGESNSQEPTIGTRWFTLTEIQANFRNGNVFKALTGAQ